MDGEGELGAMGGRNLNQKALSAWQRREHSHSVYLYPRKDVVVSQTVHSFTVL